MIKRHLQIVYIPQWLKVVAWFFSHCQAWAIVGNVRCCVFGVTNGLQLSHLKWWVSLTFKPLEMQYLRLDKTWSSSGSVDLGRNCTVCLFWSL
uniref:Putative secreted protein n=1 Tax=Amblyomma triste TaxID=251400 RepID=A0A023G077_AMBTT